MENEIANLEPITLQDLLISLGHGSPPIVAAGPNPLLGEDLRPVPPGLSASTGTTNFSGFTSTETRLSVDAQIPFEGTSEVFSAADIKLSVKIIKKLSSALATKSLEEHLFANVGSYYISKDRKYIIFYGYKKVGPWMNSIGTKATRVTLDGNSARIIGTMVRNKAFVGGIVILGAAVFDFIVNVATSDDPLSAASFREAFKKTVISMTGSLVTTSAGIAVKSGAKQVGFWAAKRWGWGIGKKAASGGLKLAKFVSPIDVFLMIFLYSPELGASDEQLLMDAMSELSFRLREPDND